MSATATQYPNYSPGLEGVPAGISSSVASARDGDFDPEKWWEKRISVKLFVREIVGMVVAMWELRGEENRQAPAPGNDGPQKPQVGHRCEPKGHIFSARLYSSPLHAVSAVLS